AMTFDPNDTRLTAYALGELDDAGRAAVEAQLAGCAESRTYVEEVRALARLLTESFQTEQQSGPALTPAQRQATEADLAPLTNPQRQPVVGKVEPAVAAAPPGPKTRWAALGYLALAASLLVGATVALLSTQQAARENLQLAHATAEAATRTPPAAAESAKP